MELDRSSWPPSSIVLVMAGVTLIGTGIYFLFLRPPLLPEDIRYMALPPAQFDVLRPRLELWLTHVFRVMGGYVLATGVLMVTLAVTSFRQHSTPAAIGALIGGAASIGWMTAVNFLIDFGLQMGSAGNGVAMGCQPCALLGREARPCAFLTSARIAHNCRNTDVGCRKSSFDRCAVAARDGGADRRAKDPLGRLRLLFRKSADIGQVPR